VSGNLSFMVVALLGWEIKQFTYYGLC